VALVVQKAEPLASPQSIASHFTAAESIVAKATQTQASTKGTGQSARAKHQEARVR
jgi:hypothetical protein